MTDAEAIRKDGEWVEDIPRPNGLLAALVFAVPLGTAMWGLILWAIFA